jgi:hypothetical protein
MRVALPFVVGLRHLEKRTMMDNLSIEYISIDKIKPYKNNAKKHPKEQVDNIAKSIEVYGFRQPIVVDKDGVIIIGHGRYLAAKQLGKTEVPVHCAADLPPKKARELRLLDNKLNESEWDYDLLKLDMDGLDFGGMDLDWGKTEIEETHNKNEESDWEAKQREFRQRMESGELSEDSEEYQEFLAKFEAKKTTDDCYTPSNIYDVVVEYVEKQYKVNRLKFVRPFYPGGDYQNEKYAKDAVVVDNPPFSILSEICRWYTEKGIKFFLFAPTLTVAGVRNSQQIVCGVGIVYENGAVVNTSFVTNMDEYKIRSAPDLYKKLEEANDKNLKEQRRQLPKYEYPNEVVTSAMVGKYSKYGVDFAVKEESCQRISELDAQKEQGKGIFGSGYLLSERAAAERAAAEIWQLSESEKEIIKKLV